MSIHEQFLTKLYHLSNRELVAINRYKVGKELNLLEEETDAIVNQLSERGVLAKVAGTKIMLSPHEKKILDSEWD